MLLPPQHLQPPGRTSNPRIVGSPTAQYVRTHSPFHSPPTAISGQLLKPQVPGNSLQPYKQHQAHWQRQHSRLLKEKHNSSEDAWASKFTRVPKSGAHIRASYKGDAKQPPCSIPVTSCLTGAAFHAAALRGNLIHFLIKHQLPQCNAPNAGGTAPCYTLKPSPGRLTQVLQEGMSLAGREGSNLTLNLQEGSLGLVANALPWYQGAALAAPSAALGTPRGLYETFSRHSRAAEASGNRRQTITALGEGTQHRPQEMGLTSGV